MRVSNLLKAADECKVTTLCVMLHIESTMVLFVKLLDAEMCTEKQNFCLFSSGTKRKRRQKHSYYEFHSAITLKGF